MVDGAFPLTLRVVNALQVNRNLTNISTFLGHFYTGYKLCKQYQKTWDPKLMEKLIVRMDDMQREKTPHIFKVLRGRAQGSSWS